jgi:hypothetical protein
MAGVVADAPGLRGVGGYRDYPIAFFSAPSLEGYLRETNALHASQPQLAGSTVRNPSANLEIIVTTDSSAKTP